MENITVYRPKKTFLWAVLAIFAIVFFGLTLPRLLEGTLETRHIQGLGGFYLVIFLLALMPFLSKLEIGKDFVRAYFLGIPAKRIESSRVRSIEYGKLMRFGGLGYGNGLKIWIETEAGKMKYYDLGETLYGKDAIDHARRVLEKRS